MQAAHSCLGGEKGGTGGSHPCCNKQPPQQTFSSLIQPNPHSIPRDVQQYRQEREPIQVLSKVSPAPCPANSQPSSKQRPGSPAASLLFAPLGQRGSSVSLFELGLMPRAFLLRCRWKVRTETRQRASAEMLRRGRLPNANHTGANRNNGSKRKMTTSTTEAEDARLPCGHGAAHPVVPPHSARCPEVPCVGGSLPAPSQQQSRARQRHSEDFPLLRASVPRRRRDSGSGHGAKLSTQRPVPPYL